MQLLHTSITVRNMDESIDFYTNKIGMSLTGRREIPQNKAEIAFLSAEGTDHRIELTWWKEKKDYSEGDQLDHIAFGVEDVYSEVDRLRKLGVEVAKEPYTLGTSKIAFVKDPNGIWIELIERKK
ncbi:MAG: VOC family protein [Thermoprotei archaeon]